MSINIKGYAMATYKPFYKRLFTAGAQRWKNTKKIWKNLESQIMIPLFILILIAFVGICLLEVRPEIWKMIGF